MRQVRDKRERLASARNRNLRQLILRAARSLNTLVQEEVLKRGYADIRLAHNTVLVNLDYSGNTVSEIADRAEMTKQAVGVLVDELESLGYVTRVVDPGDARARIVHLTERGEGLMMDMLQVIDDIEARYVEALGQQTLSGLRTGLAAFIGLRPLL